MAIELHSGQRIRSGFKQDKIYIRMFRVSTDSVRCVMTGFPAADFLIRGGIKIGRPRRTSGRFSFNRLPPQALVPRMRQPS